MATERHAAFASATPFLSSRASSLKLSYTPLRRPSIGRPGSRPRRSVIRSAADPNKILTPSQISEWTEVSAIIRTVNPALSSAEADKLVSRAFGWGSQKFWRGDVKQEAPSVKVANEAIMFLKEIVGMDEAQIGAVVKGFPEVLRLGWDRMKGNIEYVQRNYPHVKGRLLVNAVKETPAVLGFDFDCGGDCKSECARCWVQF